MHVATQVSLRMHRIQGHNASFDQSRSEQRFEGADLILLLADIALPEHRTGHHIITTQQMYRMGLLARGTHGFAIDSQVRMIEMSLTGVQAARFAPTARLRLEAE